MLSQTAHIREYSWHIYIIYQLIGPKPNEDVVVRRAGGGRSAWQAGLNSVWMLGGMRF